MPRGPLLAIARGTGPALIALVLLIACSAERSSQTSTTTSAPNVAGTSVMPSSPGTAPAAAPPSAPPSSTDAPAASTGARTAFAVLLNRAAGRGVPGATTASVIAGACYGDEPRPHWGYYNNGAAGGTIREPDGALVPLDAICLNPDQPDPYSSLLHELGHRYMWNNGLWSETGIAMGGTERAAECFARHYGAITYGQGGCSTEDADRIAALLGL